MLVLTRLVGEKIVIGEDIVVTVVSVRGNRVRLGIETPIEVPVNRKEVYDKIKESHDTIQEVHSAIRKMHNSKD